MPKQLAIESPLTNFDTLGPIAGKYLKKYFNKTSCDIYERNNKFFIGNKEAKIDNDDIIIDEKKYKGTSGLWELLTNNIPKDYSQDDLTNYGNILHSTNAMYRNFDSTQNNPRSSNSYKWKNIVGDIWKTRPLTIKEISDDPNELIKRFKILLSSKESGNTGVNDEMISIVNKLKNNLSPEEYKIMMSQAEEII